MGGVASVAIQIPLGGLVNVYKHYFYNLEKNLRAVEKEISNVEKMRDDVLGRILIEESRGHERLDSVKWWLEKVERATRGAYELMDDAAQFERNMCLCGYNSRSCSKSRYRYGKKVHGLLKDLKEIGDNKWVAGVPIYTEASPPSLVGQEITLENTRKMLKEDRVGILALYGMAGIGKTQLISRLYNEISTDVASPFDTLLWITASQGNNGVQDIIGRRLALYNEEWGQKSVSQKAMSIHRILQRNRFLMVLDDVWEDLSLEDIGVPLPTSWGNGSKIVITSRLRRVCEAMGADDYIEVRPLDMDKAWELFQNIVGDINVRRNPELARRIVDRCNGNPLVLQIVGASLASTTSIRTWEAILLNSEPLGEQYDKDRIFNILKSSYDALEGKTIKMCFLLCALFPEDQEIRKEELVELWIGEQIIAEDKYEENNSLGHEIIRKLLDENLLMEAESREKIKMHDLIRDMALSIASHPELDKENIIVESYTQVDELSNIKQKRDLSRVSLIGDDTKTLSDHLDCPKLKTLFARDAMLEAISPEFFTCLPLLVVLDLSLNQHLNKLPDAISELVLLRYLNLSSTGIKQLPPGLSKLTELIFLNLEHTHMLQDITGISDLVSKIQVLRLRDSGFRASSSLLDELLQLKHLELLTITLQDEDVVQQFLRMPKLVRCTQGFYLEYCAVSSSINISSLSRGLRCLDIQYSYIPGMEIDPIASEAEEITTVFSPSPTGEFFRNLSKVKLDGCNGLRELTWLLFAPQLSSLRVVQSKDIEEIISKDKAPNLDIVPFEGLGFLALESLVKLKTIYWKPLPLPMLREIRVRSCPGLRKLPVDSKSATEKNLVISAEKEFMRGLKWEDEATKQRFFPNVAGSSDKASVQKTSREA